MCVLVKNSGFSVVQPSTGVRNFTCFVLNTWTENDSYCNISIYKHSLYKNQKKKKKRKFQMISKALLKTHDQFLKPFIPRVATLAFLAESKLF